MANKVAKIPLVGPETKFLSFDLESNGLHGGAFAIGAVVIDAKGKVYDSFTARCQPTEDLDPWVASNVLPAIEDIQITHGNYEAMREAFWRWFVAAQDESDYVLVHNGYPVEYRFLLDCQEADLDERYWQHPFPIIDVASLLLLAGEARDEIRKKTERSFSENNELRHHHPVDDATLSALIAFATIRAIK